MAWKYWFARSMAFGHHHVSRLAADLVLGHYLGMQMVHHDLRLQADGVLVTLDEVPPLLLRLFDVERRVVLSTTLASW